MGKRPLKDFEDPRLKAQVITEDFQSILQVAVLCVARSNKGRPNIDQVFQELDKAWKNTVVQMVGMHNWIVIILYISRDDHKHHKKKLLHNFKDLIYMLMSFL